MANSTVTAVTLFQDRARVRRTMSAVLQPGLQKLVMDELTMAMDTGSVRARGSGTATATLLGVATRIENFVDAPVDGLRDLETRAQTLSDAIADLDAHANAIQKEAASVETLMGQGASFARGINKGQRTPANQLATLATLRERLMVLQGDGLVAARERRDKARELDKIKRDMDQVVTAQPRRRYAAEIDVDVKEAGELVIELTYNVYGASWHPLYDLRSSETGLEVRYLAEVQQNTGEDWVDVALTLSTAQPNASLVVPELDPWYVIPKPPMPPPLPRAMHARPADATMMMAAPAAPISMAGGPFAKLNEMTVNEAAVSASGAALNFDLPARASIPGNGDPRKVTVAVLALKPRMDYISAPKVDATVYRRCTVKNDTPYTLLPGRGQLFEGDNYLGACTIEQTAPGQEMKLALGSDERVLVERDLSQREVDKTLLGDKRRTRFGYKITLENLRSESINLLLRDQIPVSQSEDIKIRLEVADPKVGEQSNLNLLECKLSLAAGEKRVIRYEFTVEHPRQMEILGLS